MISVMLTGLIVIFIAGWYAVSRIRSNNNRLFLYSFKQETKETQNIENRRLKIGAFNIAHARGGKYGAKNWQYSTEKELLEHLDKIAEQIIKENPDVMVLNEADFSSAWSFHINQAEYIARKCGYAHVLEQRNMDFSFPFYYFCFGNAILSRYPMKNEKFVDFQPYSKIEDIFAGNHDAVFCELESPFGLFNIFAIHLEYRSEDVRVRSAETLIKMCSELKYPIILLGDFNSTPPGFSKSDRSKDGENAMSLLFDKGGFISYLKRKSHSDDYTFPSEKPEMVIDWILGKGIEKFSGSKNIKSDISDHLMIVSEIY